tara:strand:- start:814 stop:1077 length:264 start_codon:yes stop_codon:yes gene_type:complete
MPSAKKKHPKTKNLTNTILAKWRSQGSFIRFIDGNRSNCAVHNLAWIDMATALVHWDDWTFDFDMNLTSQEREYANNPNWRAGLIVR